MTDRLAELKQGALAPHDIEFDLEANPGGPRNDKGGISSSMQGFFNDVEVVKRNIMIIRSSSKKVAEINQQVVLATTNEKEMDESQELAEVLAETNKKATATKTLLKTLRDDTDALKKSSLPKQSELRIRENLVNTLTRKFVDVMKEYQNTQTKYKNDIKKKVKRQVQIVKPDATAEEVEAVLKSGGGSSDVIRGAILRGDAADSIRNAFENIASKYQDVLTLEASVAELHQMFLDFALLTEQQGELLDQIEYQVKSASDYIEEGNKDMVQAIEIQKSIRKKQCCIIIFVLVIIGIIIIAIVLGTQSSRIGLKRH